MVAPAGTPTYLYHVVAEQGPSWYSAISGHPHAQSPAYAPAHVHRGIPGVTGVAVNHYWRGSGSTTEAFIAVNAWPQTLGSRDRATHYVFSGIFETSDFGGPKPYLNRLWQTFELRRTNWVAGGTSHDAHRVVAGISWTDVQGRRYILEINLHSSDNSEGWCRDRTICVSGRHHGTLERYITMGGRALGFGELTGDKKSFGIYWGSLISYLRSAQCVIDGETTSCLPDYAMHYDGNDAHCTFSAGVSTEVRGYGFVELGVSRFDLVDPMSSRPCCQVNGHCSSLHHWKTASLVADGKVAVAGVHPAAIKLTENTMAPLAGASI